ncbi:MAG: cation-translocating P-type ATPase [Bacteriovorax sp.]
MNTSRELDEFFKKSGLSSAFVLERQKAEGENTLPSMRPRRLHAIIAGALKEPMVYLLMGCSIAYFFIGDAEEAIMLLAFLLLIIIISVSQEAKAEKALEALKGLSSPRALVLRDGLRSRIAASELVREDLIFINEGDRIPADCILIKGQNVASDESLLTGESLPVNKDMEDLLFAGTAIVQGQGVAKITAIGAQTEMAKIGKSIAFSIAGKTKLEKQTRALVKKVASFAVVLCVLVTVLYALKNHNWAQGSLIGLSLAMAILPNELPAVLTIFLALGAWRLSKRKILTRKLSAVENLGAATVLCVDKTGTITLNQMRVERIYSNSLMIDLTDQKIAELPEEFHEALEFGILASRKNPFDPMEVAFISAGEKFLKNTEHLHFDWSLEKEYPLSNELLAMTMVWKPMDQGGYIVGAKGAPEAIIDLCHLNGDEEKHLLKKIDEFASVGLRVIGVAKSKLQDIYLPTEQTNFPFSFVGLIGIADPVRDDVPEAITQCHQAGIRVMMITGDHPFTASSIAEKIGLPKAREVMTGKELCHLNEKEFLAVIKTVNVFSRVSHQQKLQIVEALKASGEIVAMTGDGVNDAPALKSAHIGIAMGKRGTDVAREAADLVLLEDDFASIVVAIKTGRRVYANLKNALIYLFAIHIPIAGMSVVPVIFNLPLVMLPAHIAFLHLIIEPTSSIAFEIEEAERSLMLSPPRPPNRPLFDKWLWLPSALKGLSVLIALVAVFVISLKRGQGELDARALVFSTLIIANSILIYKKNLLIKWIIFASFFMLASVLYVPALRHIFHFSFLHPLDIVLCVFVGSLSVLWIEFMGDLRYGKSA